MLGDGVDLVIHADDAALAGMPDVVRDMHARSGLTEEVRRVDGDRCARPSSRCSTTSASTSPSRAPPRWPATRSPPTAASSPATCPSSTRTCTTGWSTSARSRSCAGAGIPRVFYAKPEKGLAHRALADIRESIRELDYYRRTLFVARARPDDRAGPGRRRRTGRRSPRDPGPDTAGQRAVSWTWSPAPAGDAWWV